MTITADELTRLTLTAAAAAARRGDVSARELVEAALRRIAHLDGELNSFIELRAEEALAEARRLDKSKSSRAPLHGVPIAVKDNLAVAGMHARAGSKLLVGVRQQTTATAVRQLRRAGAIVVGHSSMYELAFGAQSPYWPEPVNPRSRSVATAGSSSGSAAAVAAGLVFGAVATDTGGSIRVPASFCGVVGVRPSEGTVSRRGLIRLSRLDQIGPMARSVADVATLHRLLRNPSRGPSRQVAAPLRVAVPEYVDTNEDVVAAIDAFCEQLSETGIRVRRSPALPVQDAAEALWTTASADAARLWHREVEKAPGLVHPLVRQRIRDGAGPDPGSLGRARHLRESVRRAVLSELDAVQVLVLPAAACSGYQPGGRFVATPRGREDVSSAVTRYTALASVAGAPALVLPCRVGRRDRPIGVQLVARPGGEETLFALGERYEAGQ